MLNRKKCLFSGLGLFLFLGGIFLFSQVQANSERLVDVGQQDLEKPVYVEGEVLVKFKEEKVDLKEDKGLEQVEKLEKKEKVDRDETRDIATENIALFEAEEGQSTEELIEDLRDDSRVESVQPNYLYYPLVQTIPWGVDDTYGVKAQSANTSGYTGAGVVVAVIDTGVLHSHVDLDGNMWSPSGDNCYIDGVLTAGGCPNHGYDFGNGDNDPTEASATSHGTHVAGTIAAEDNDAGVVGVAPDAEIMAINAINPVSGAADTNSLVRAMEFAKDNGADIVNMSLGHYHQSSLRAGSENFDNYFREAIETATAAGVLSIAASGNDSLSIYGYPAGFSDVISVGSVNITDERSNPSEDMSTRLSYFSNYGNVDVVAPGYEVMSTTGDGSYSGATWAGTSMACPHVAGIAALIKEKYSTATPAQIRQILQTTATDLGDTGRDQYFGSGLADASAAIGTLSQSILLETNWAEDNDTDEPSQYLPAMPADGTSTTKLRTTVANSSGVPVAGVTVYWSTDLGTLSASSAITDASGQATVTLTAASTSGTATVATAADDYGSATAEVSMANILLVSDTGEPYRHVTANNMSWFYTQTLENLGYNFVRYETYHRDIDDWVSWDDVIDQTPTVEYMQKFDLVIWYTGDWPLYNQSIVYDYLAAGGNLIMTGQDAGYYYNAGTVTDNGLYANYLKASYVSDGATTDTSVTGLDILSGVDLTLTSRYSSYGFGAGSGVGGGLYPDHITPDSNATALAEYSSGAADAGLRYYNGTTRVIYLPWAFDTITYQANRETVMQNMTESILPLQIVTRANVKKTSKNDINKINVKSEDEVTVRVDFDDEPATGIVYVELSDGTNTVSAYQAVDSSDVTQTLEDIDCASLDTGSITVKAANAYSPASATSLTAGTSAYKNEVINKPENLRTPTKKRKVRTVRLKWDEVKGANYYKVNLRSKSGKQIKTFTSVSNEYKDVKKKYTKSNYAMKFRVKVCTTNLGCGSYSDYDNFRTLPAKVKSLDTVPNSDGTVTASWDAVRGKDITYRVKVMDSSKNKLKTYNTTKTSKVLSQIDYYYNYQVKVRAKYNDNNIGKWSSISLYDLW